MEKKQTPVIEATAVVVPENESPAVSKTLEPSTSITPEKPTTNQLVEKEAGGKVSVLSLSSIRARKELMEQQKSNLREESKQLPTEKFTATELLEQWYKYADRLNDKGHKIMEALLRINDPKIEGTTVIHSLPNEGSKLDFEKEKPELVAFLRAKLHNHEITLEIEVNEEVKSKVPFTPQDKFNRLNEINPNLELLKKYFDLEL